MPAAREEKGELVLKVNFNNVHKFMVVVAKNSCVSLLKSEISKVASSFSSTDLGEIISVKSCNYELPHIYKVGRLLKKGDCVQAYTAGHVANHAGSGVDQNAVTRARQRTRVSPAVEQGKESRRKRRHSRTQSIDKSGLADEHQKNDVGQSPSTSFAFKEMLESPECSSQSGVQAKKSGRTSLVKRKSTEVLIDTPQEACSDHVAAPLNNNSNPTQYTDKMSQARALSVEDNCDEKKKKKEKKKRRKRVESEDDVDEEEMSRTKRSSQTGQISRKEESEAVTKPVLQINEEIPKKKTKKVKARMRRNSDGVTKRHVK